jgi:hypothetical protein
MRMPIKDIRTHAAFAFRETQMSAATGWEMAPYLSNAFRNRKCANFGNSRVAKVDTWVDGYG